MLNLFTRRAVLTYLSLLRVSSLTDIQWVKKTGRINGVAVLLGQGQSSWLKGCNNKYTIYRIPTSWTTVLFNKHPECKFTYSNCKNYLKLSFSKDNTSKNRLLNRYKCILRILSKKQYKIRLRYFNILNFERVAILTGWNYKRFYCLGLQNVAVGCINEGFL